MRPFVVSLPSGVRYWTVLDDDLLVVAEADAFLRHLRLGRDCSALTTCSYAGGISLFLQWCASTGKHWHVGVEQLGLFITWLRHAGPRDAGSDAFGGEGTAVVLAGPGRRPVRGSRRINAVLTAVRGFVAHAVTSGNAPGTLLQLIYELADDRNLPEQARGEDRAMAWRMRARHRLREPDAGVDRASDSEIVALIAACRSARDRLIVLWMARAGLRRSDVHLLVDSGVLGCGVPRARMHVVRRDNANGAWAKSRRQLAVPLDSLLVRAFDTYVFERLEVPGTAESDFVLVNLFRGSIGAPMPPDAINGLLTAADRRAGLSRRITPHQLRHAFGSNLADAGGTLDGIAALLGHQAVSSSQVYLHPDPARLREAVKRVPTPREQTGTEL